MVFCFFFVIKAYVVGTNLNCFGKLMHFKRVSTTCSYKEIDEKYTGCNLKIMESLHCMLKGVCAVIKSNTVHFNLFITQFIITQFWI